jgi:hypothetical protein
MVWHDPRTWVAGEKPPAATLNEHIRDNFKAIGDPWAAWGTAPAWTAATTNPVLGNGTLTHGLLTAGKSVGFWVEMVAGGTTTFGSGSWLLSLPYTPNGIRWVFNGVARDSSANQSYPLFFERSGSLLAFRALPSTAGNPFSNANSTVPFTWASGDSWTVMASLMEIG